MTTPHDAVIEALRATLESNPRNAPVWIHLADLLVQSGSPSEAMDALRTAQHVGGDPLEVTRRLVPLLREAGQLAEALIRCEEVVESTNDRDLRLELARILEARGNPEGAASQRDLAGGSSEGETRPPASPAVPPSAPPEVPTPEPETSADSTPDLIPIGPQAERDLDDWASQFDWGDLHMTFDDVVGLEEVKRQIRLRIIAPMQQQSVFRAFNRTGGGGLLLYGPPGCGKTYIAKATAGECKATFISVGIHEMLDKYWGESEKLIHSIFEQARRRTPAVLFLDEFDALASGRGGDTSQFFKSLCDQLLQEMDGMSGDNENLLVFAATNVPWNIDSAFRRPGRFDRMFFVPPPDAVARTELLSRHVEKLPGGEKIDPKSLTPKTGLFTGADLVSLCERASEQALEKSLDSGEIHPVSAQDFANTLARMQSSALEWLATARNYARYSNEAGQYDDLQDFLKRVKKW